MPGTHPAICTAFVLVVGCVAGEGAQYGGEPSSVWVGHSGTECCKTQAARPTQTFARGDWSAIGRVMCCNAPCAATRGLRGRTDKDDGKRFAMPRLLFASALFVLRFRLGLCASGLASANAIVYRYSLPHRGMPQPGQRRGTQCTPCTCRPVHRVGVAMRSRSPHPPGPAMSSVCYGVTATAHRVRSETVQGPRRTK